MSEKILNDIRKAVGLDENDSHFDRDLKMHINSTLSVLTQLGIGPDDGFRVDSGDETWADFMNDNKLFNMVKSYMFLRVQSLFDPTSNSSLFSAFETLLKEYEWRIGVAVDESKVI